MKRSGIVVFIFVLTLPFGVARAQVQAADPFTGVPGVTFKFYDVQGQSWLAIKASADAQRPLDPADGHQVYAFTKWHIAWRLKQDINGCHVVTPLEFSAEVQLPQLMTQAPRSPQIAQKWNRFLEALKIHKSGHVRFAFEHIGDVEAALSGPSCAEANAAGAAATQKIAEHDAVYDRETRHGATQGALLPAS